MSEEFPNYCSQCGAALVTRVIEGRERAFCTECESPIYRNAKPCAGVLIIDSDSVLLVKRTNPPAVGSWSLPAGYLEIDETPREAAVRELGEETGLDASEDCLSLFDTQLVTHEDGSQVLVIVYTTTVTHTSGTPTAGSDAAAARFWKLDALRAAGERIEPGYEKLFRRAVSEVYCGDASIS